jgi:hypothetical protein
MFVALSFWYFLGLYLFYAREEFEAQKKMSPPLAIRCARDICDFCVVLAVLTCPCHVFFAYA